MNNCLYYWDALVQLFLFVYVHSCQRHLEINIRMKKMNKLGNCIQTKCKPYMQWAIVRTQLDVMSIPPQK